MMQSFSKCGCPSACPSGVSSSSLSSSSRSKSMLAKKHLAKEGDQPQSCPADIRCPHTPGAEAASSTAAAPGRWSCRAVRGSRAHTALHAMGRRAPTQDL
eukprot:6172104-Pleurochrysis_carterae.AAC.3